MHAIQDRDFDFDVINAGVELEDAFLSTRAVIEGDADHNSIAWAFELLETPLTTADWAALHDDAKRILRGTIVNPDVSVIDLGASFPYVHGGEFVGEAILSEGLGVRQELWTNGPTASAAVMSGYAAFTDRTVPARDVPESAYPAVPAEYEEIVKDELGAWTLFVFLHHFGVGQDLAWDVALASIGDVFSVYESEADTVTVWRVRFAPTELAVGDVVDVALDRLGSAAEMSFVEGNDVVIVAAETQMALDNWLAEPMEPFASRIATKGAPRRIRGVRSKGTCVKSALGIGRFE